MSVLAPPPSPTHSNLDIIMSDSDINVEHHRQSIKINRNSNSLKRKGSSHPCSSSDTENIITSNDAIARSNPSKKAKTAVVPTTPLVELKNGRLVLKQKSLNWALTVPVMKAVIDFQTFLSCQDKLEKIPHDQLHVVAKLVQESERTLGELAKVVRNALMPEADLGFDDSKPSPSVSSSSKNKLTLPAIQEAIATVAERRNYGLDASNVSSSSDASLDDTNIPASLQVWRWEVKDESLLPKENLEKIVSRKKERESARLQAVSLFSYLSEAERLALLKKSSKAKISATISKELLPAPSSPPSSKNAANSLDPIVIDSDDDDGSQGDVEDAVSPSQSPKSASKSKKKSDPANEPLTPQSKKKTKEDESTPEKLKEKEEKDTAKTKRMKQKEAKKAEKEAREAEKLKAKEASEAEVKKQLELKKKQASFFTSFIQRAQQKSDNKAEPKKPKTDFEKAFRPCQYKDLAPINRFAKLQPKSSRAPLEFGQHGLTREQMMADFVKNANHKPQPKPKPRKKGVHPATSVRDIKRIVTESDVLGGNAQDQARKALEELQDRKKIQIKLLQFDTDRRPGWYGTWTKSTNLISPRCPFGQDPVFLDYTYDSDADWEDLDQVDGDDVQDADDKEEEEESAVDSDGDSEMHDWLVDDLEVEEEEEPPEEDDPDIFEVDVKGIPIAKSTPTSVKQISSSVNNVDSTHILHPKKKKKVKLLGRRFDSKLVPFSTGPHWESVFGQPEYENFTGYQIEFLNDAYFGLDPFTFTSQPIIPSQDPTISSCTTKDIISTPTKSSLIKHHHQPSPLPAGSVLATLWASAIHDPTLAPDPLLSCTTTTTPNSKPTSFPESQVSELLKAIEGSTKTRAGLIDDLKEKFLHLGKSISKNSLNERVSHFAAKQTKKPGTPWKVKPEFRHYLS